MKAETHLCKSPHEIRHRQAVRLVAAYVKPVAILYPELEMIEPKPDARRWTITEDRLLHEMLNAGLTAEEIGRRLARTPIAIYSRVQRLERKNRKLPTS
jgi:hypothetical protein